MYSLSLDAWLLPFWLFHMQEDSCAPCSCGSFTPSTHRGIINQTLLPPTLVRASPPMVDSVRKPTEGCSLSSTNSNGFSNNGRIPLGLRHSLRHFVCGGTMANIPCVPPYQLSGAPRDLFSPPKIPTSTAGTSCSGIF